MSLKRLGPTSGFCPESVVIFENFGATSYAAQLYEGFLQNIITGLERLGALVVPPDTRRGNDGFVDATIGDILHILQSQGTIDSKTGKILKKAHYQRNFLVHSFLAESTPDMLNAAGCASINERLLNIFTNIQTAVQIVSAVSTEIWTRLGVSREEHQRQIDEWMRFRDNSTEDESRE